MKDEEIRDLVKRVKSGLRIRSVTATRTVKGQFGETQAGFEGELPESMTLSEAVVANCLLSREADLAAIRNAIAGGNVTLQYGSEALAMVKSGYAKLLVQVLEETEGSK